MSYLLELHAAHLERRARFFQKPPPAAIAAQPWPEPPPPPPIRDAFKDPIKFDGRLTVMQIQHVVAREFGISVDDLRGRRRSLPYVRPRQVAMYLAKLLIAKSTLPEIGRRSGGYDHTTVLNAVRKMPAYLAANPAMAVKVEGIKDMLVAGAMQ